MAMNYKPVRLTDKVTVGPWTGTLAELLADEHGIRLGVAKGGKHTPIEVMREDVGYIVADMEGAPKVSISVVVKRDTISPTESKQVEHTAAIQQAAKETREAKDERMADKRVSDALRAQSSAFAQVRSGSIGAKVEDALANTVAARLGNVLALPDGK